MIKTIKEKEITFAESINFSTISLMKKNKSIIAFGLGIDDPKRIFGTTNNLKELFGKNRVFDTPASENAMTGIGIGMSLNKIIPIMIHQRMDFFLLAMDQLINNAAKWNFMFGNKDKINIVIRLIIGRGWGQGPTHSQNFQSLFANIPGIEILSPTFPESAKRILNYAVSKEKPILIIEHRWLYNIRGLVDFKKIRTPKSIKPQLIRKGKDVTIVSHSYSLIELLKIENNLKFSNISFDLIDLQSLKPIDYKLITKSLKKTGKIIVFDNSSHGICSIASEIISKISINCFHLLKKAPMQITLPEFPSPSSHFLIKDYYITGNYLLKRISEFTGKKIKKFLDKEKFYDVPDNKFTGPF